MDSHPCGLPVRRRCHCSTIVLGKLAKLNNAASCPRAGVTSPTNARRPGSLNSRGHARRPRRQASRRGIEPARRWAGPGGPLKPSSRHGAGNAKCQTWPQSPIGQVSTPTSTRLTDADPRAAEAAKRSCPQTHAGVPVRSGAGGECD